HAAIDDVHHRHRQRPRRGAADIAVERHVEGFRRSLGDRQRDAENGIGAEAALVRRAVEIDHDLVDLHLLFGGLVAYGFENFAVDGLDRVLHAFAEIAGVIAVAQLDRLMRTGRGTRRHRCPSQRAILQHDIDFDRRIAAAIENFAADDVDDGGHGSLLERWNGWLALLLQQAITASHYSKPWGRKRPGDGRSLIG